MLRAFGSSASREAVCVGRGFAQPWYQTKRVRNELDPVLATESQTCHRQSLKSLRVDHWRVCFTPLYKQRSLPGDAPLLIDVSSDGQVAFVPRNALI